ncbi:MAG: glycosyltransferase family 9 protein [Betaproteobacteria bacterium]
MTSRAVSRPAVFALAAARMAASAIAGRRRRAPAAPRRILIAHHLLLGDTIMLTPLIAKCRARWPNAEIAMTCPIAYMSLYEGRPYGLRALPYDPREPATLGPLVAGSGFDLALVPADNRLSWLARALDARWIVAFAGDSPPYKDWPVDLLRPYPDVPTAWGDLVAGLVDGPAPAPYRIGDWPAPAVGRFEPPPAAYCVLHAGASTPLKQWPAARWRDLGERLAGHGLGIVLSAGPFEEALLDGIDRDRHWIRYAGTLTVGELWHLLARAALVVCPDTGVAHLARLTGTPTVALFGPGSASLSGAGEFWRDAPFTALTIAEFPCRDQRITMKREVAWIRRCERLTGERPGQCAEARCMNAIDGDAVYRSAAAHLGPRPDAAQLPGGR